MGKSSNIDKATLAQHSLCHKMFCALPVAFYVKDKSRCYIMANEAGLQIKGLSSLDQIIGKSDEDFFSENICRQLKELDDMILDGSRDSITRDVGFKDAKGRKAKERWFTITQSPKINDETGEIDGILGMAQEITQRKLSDQELWKQAHLDSLTGLRTRWIFIDIVEQRITLAERLKSVFGIMFLDLDGFKAINDTYGHEAGDEMLRMVADRLVNTVRRSDLICRMGGDEFTIVLTEIKDREGIEGLAKKLLAVLSAPYIICGVEMNVSASIGIAIYPDHGASGKRLIKAADDAMYLSKQAGRNTFKFKS